MLLLAILSLICGVDPFIRPDLFAVSSHKEDSTYKARKELSLVLQVLSLVESSNEDVWPGLKLNESPTVLTFDKGPIYAVGINTLNKPWKKLEKKGKQVFVAEEDKWGLGQIKMHPAFNLDGQRAFVFQMNLEPRSPNIFAHERFHLYQFEHFKPTPPARGGYLDHLNVENLALMAIEDDLLIEFLRTPTFLKEERVNLLKDFISIHEERKKCINPSSKTWEDIQQKMEGLADYVSAKMFEGEREVLRSMRSFDECDFSDYAIKWRHYMVGATLGFSLDFIEAPHWKKQVEEGKFLQEILEEQLALSHEEKNSRTQNLIAKMVYPELLSEMKAKVEEFEKQLKALLDRYSGMDGVTIRLSHPRGLGISGGGNSEKLLCLSDGTTLNIQDSSSSATTDSNWKFITKAMPFTVQHPMGYREFKAENALKIVLNEKPHSVQELLEKPGEYPFVKLYCEGEHFNLSSEKHSGKLISDGKILSIVYERPAR